MNLTKFIELVEEQGQSNGRYYLAEYPIFEVLPELKSDVKTFPYWTNVYHRHRCLKNLLWIGAAGCSSTLHFDINHNFVAQFRGRKLWKIYPEEQHALLGLPSDLPGKRNVSPIDVKSPDLECFPRFARARPIEFMMNPGETLFLPGRWAHQVDTVDPSIMMNFWWTTMRTTLRNLPKDFKVVTVSGFRNRMAPKRVDNK
jgi:lysine-specific demethylase 8